MTLRDMGLVLAGTGNISFNHMIDMNIKRYDSVINPLIKLLTDTDEAKEIEKIEDPEEKKARKKAFHEAADKEFIAMDLMVEPYKIKLSKLPENLKDFKLSDRLSGISRQAKALKEKLTKAEKEEKENIEKQIEDLESRIRTSIEFRLIQQYGDLYMNNLWRVFAEGAQVLIDDEQP